jgi:hypothetical protein
VAYSSATRFSLHSQLLVGSLPQGKGSRFPDGNRLADKHTFLRGASVGQTHFRKASKFESLSICPPNASSNRPPRRLRPARLNEGRRFLGVLEAHGDAVVDGSKTFLGRFPMTIPPQYAASCRHVNAAKAPEKSPSAWTMQTLILVGFPISCIVSNGGSGKS